MHEPYTIIHGGFHWTESAYLQDTLQRNQGYLAKHGVLYVDQRDTRKNLILPCQRSSAVQAGKRKKSALNDAALRDLTQRFFKPVQKERPQRLILSDENLAGHRGHYAKRGALYRTGDSFMGVVAQEIPFPVREVHVAVRNYADFFASAYVDYIRSLKPSTKSVIFPREMVDQVMTSLLDWNGLIDEIMRAFSSAKIYVWRFEDFCERPDMQAQVLRNLVGPDVNLGKFKRAKAPPISSAASARAMQDIQNLILSQGIATAVEHIDLLHGQFPTNAKNARFDPWTAWEHRHLANLYAQDISRLARDPGVILMRPE